VSVTHIASENVVIGDRYLRQRCGWCGEVLLEYDLARVAVPVGGDPTPATWPHGALVRVDGNASTLVEPLISTPEGVPELPYDACARNPLTFASFG
jgi:hypothetical protein